MKTLLIQPGYEGSIATPPLGLGYIASTLEANGNEVHLIDLTKNPLTHEILNQKVAAIEPEIVGISLMSRALIKVRKLVSALREVTDVPIVLGGPQPSIIPEYTLEQTNAEFAVMGEGEITITELVQTLQKGKNQFNKIAGLAFKGEKGKIHVNPPRKLIENLDDISFPAWHLMLPKSYDYKPVLSTAKAFPIAQMITTRGCPYKCNFCGGHAIWGRTFRRRSPRNVVDEMQLLIEKYGVSEIFFCDDNFTLGRTHAAEVCNEIIRRGIDIFWACPNGVRIDHLDKDLLRLMRKAGCHSLGFGIESGNQSILDRANKNLDLKKVRQVLSNAHNEGITTYGFFILGLIGETPATIRQTINFAKELPLDRAWFNILIPFPGTEVFDLFIRNQCLEDLNWDEIDSSTGMITTGIEYESLTADDLVRWQRKAVREFYARPRILFNVLKTLSFGGLKTLVHQSFFKRLF